MSNGVASLITIAVAATVMLLILTVSSCALDMGYDNTKRKEMRYAIVQELTAKGYSAPEVRCMTDDRDYFDICEELAREN